MAVIKHHQSTISN